VFTKHVRDIAERFNPVDDLSRVQKIAIKITPEFWKKNRFMSAYKGSWVHKEFKEALKEIEGGQAYEYKTVGPDVIPKNGLKTDLKYEITQHTPTLHAIEVHARRYYNDVLRYVTYKPKP
jgi:hypothetical protein